MKAKDMRQQTATELNTMVKSSRDKLADLAVDMRTKQPKDVKEISRLKKDVARALTLLNEARDTEETKS
jgi:ribosomal protein L29